MFNECCFNVLTPYNIPTIVTVFASMLKAIEKRYETRRCGALDGDRFG